MRQRVWLSAVLVAVMASCLPARGQIFGPSDEEKAHEASQDQQLQQNEQSLAQLQAQLRDLSDQVHSLTDSLARATGANEELGHRIDLLSDKIDRQQKDFSYHLCILSAQQLGADTDTSGLNCASAGTQSAMRPDAATPQVLTPGAALAPLGENSPASDAPARGRTPGILGTFASGASDNAPASSVPPSDNASFDVALNLLAKAQYDEARAGFRAYADNNPDDSDLAPQAVFWVGDIDFVRRDYPSAARDFAELIKKYPASMRAPDAMLKLGQSLLEMGQKSEGCTTLGALKSKFPDAPPATLSAAQGARKAACT